MNTLASLGILECANLTSLCLQPIVVLLAFPALFCCCSKTSAMPVAMLVLSKLELQMAQPSEVQHSTALRDTDAAARFTSVAPAGWSVRAVVPEEVWQLGCCL
uniref:Uncharacterized protein n=1 Tax=Pavo cristatus TaxID=9049 RepID=A0A8C9FAV3_PAVCR